MLRGDGYLPTSGAVPEPGCSSYAGRRSKRLSRKCPAAKERSARRRCRKSRRMCVSGCATNDNLPGAACDVIEHATHLDSKKQIPRNHKHVNQQVGGGRHDVNRVKRRRNNVSSEHSTTVKRILLSTAGILSSLFISHSALAEPFPSDFVIFTVPGEKAVKYVVPSNHKDVSGTNAAGGKVKVLIDDGLKHPHGLAFDRNTQALFVTDSTAQRVYQYDITAASNEELTATAQREVARNVEAHWLAVDPRNNTLYLTSKTSNMICSVYLDDQDGACHVIYQGDTAENPKGLANIKSPAGIDVDGHKLFYGNGQEALTKGSVMSATTTVGAVPTVNKLPNKAITETVQGVCASRSNVFYTDGISNLYAIKKWGGTPLVVSNGLSAGAGCTWDGDGAMYVADSKSIRKFPANMGTLHPVLHLDLVANTAPVADVAVFSTKDV
ncbi:unnamed protein product [Amoebophrya sp. A25]|nr:unnamed protein product [Amoebophrya sp. A25]|eukprot:GSA25T00005756001.1